LLKGSPLINYKFDCKFPLQALDVIRQLKETIPIEKAQMRIRIVLPKDNAKKLREKLLPSVAKVESEDWDCGKLELV